MYNLKLLYTIMYTQFISYVFLPQSICKYIEKTSYITISMCQNTKISFILSQINSHWTDIFCPWKNSTKLLGLEISCFEHSHKGTYNHAMPCTPYVCVEDAGAEEASWNTSLGNQTILQGTNLVQMEFLHIREVVNMHIYYIS